MFYPVELEAELRLAGFHSWDRFGDYRRAQFGSDSPKQIVLARA